jgi:hypothetical protein
MKINTALALAIVTLKDKRRQYAFSANVYKAYPPGLGDPALVNETLEYDRYSQAIDALETLARRPIQLILKGLE